MHPQHILALRMRVRIRMERPTPTYLETRFGEGTQGRVESDQLIVPIEGSAPESLYAPEHLDRRRQSAHLLHPRTGAAHPWDQTPPPPSLS